MPRFSVIMPAFNRADTIARAVKSVMNQSFEDWELMLIDDGSTDGTADVVSGVDPRVKIIRQSNQGIAGARNTGMKNSTGEIISFLDSDDEWLPHHLELADSFFKAFPDEHVVSNEFWEDFGQGRIIKHFRNELTTIYPLIARKLKCAEMSGPAPSGDCYLKLYQERLPLWDTARKILEEAGYPADYFYRGFIANHWRWGYMSAMQPALMRRKVVDTLGLFDTTHPIATDFEYLHRICASYRMNLIPAPSAIKHEYAGEGEEIKEGHLATGKTGIAMLEEMLDYHDRIFCQGKEDQGAIYLRGYKEYELARLQLKRGNRVPAIRLLEKAGKDFPPFWEARLAARLLKLIPSSTLGYSIWEIGSILRYTQSAIRRGNFSCDEIMARLSPVLFFNKS